MGVSGGDWVELMVLPPSLLVAAAMPAAVASPSMMVTGFTHGFSCGPLAAAWSATSLAWST